MVRLRMAAEGLKAFGSWLTANPLDELESHDRLDDAKFLRAYEGELATHRQAEQDLATQLEAARDAPVRMPHEMTVASSVPKDRVRVLEEARVVRIVRRLIHENA